MNILFYSTSSNYYDGDKTSAVTFPSWSEQWQKAALENPEHRITIATQLPGMFLLDVKANEISSKAESIRYEIIPYDNEDEIADFLSELKPDIAVAASFYVAPFDWLNIKDAIIAEKLRSRGIKAICHPVESGMICFDKWQTHQKLKELGINCAKAVYFHHELFINGGNRREIKSNVYRTYLFNEMKKLKYPVIIKDCTGLSSYGMDVVNNFEEAKSIILSKKTSSDRIIEELIQGIQAGTEIIRTGEGTTILPPFIFSVNKYGITSPKQSVKAGPVSNEEKFNLPELRKMLKQLSDKLLMNGLFQADLVLEEKTGKWFVIEINTRLSGMSATYASYCKKNLPERLIEIADEKTGKQIPHKNSDYVLNIKFPLLSEEKLKKIQTLPFIDFVNQIENLGAKQLREMGYCEVILNGTSVKKLEENLIQLKENFPEEMEDIFFKKAVSLLSLL